MRNYALGIISTVLSFAATASAQVGPDVITWRIGGTSGGGIIQYSPANGKDAFSFTTVSCNIGDTVLLWESGGSIRHPVIAQNVLRLKEGRFEQLGQSFLKHGFCALSQSDCGTCQATPCSTLGIGCADTYGAGLNDGAGGGRKSQVNACRGDHVHPYSSPAGTDPNRGRLQVYSAELDQSVNNNSSAVYFIEAHYVTEDDHLAGNATNNASWRKVTVDSSRDLSESGADPTIVDPGIYAWQAEDAAVVINEVLNYNEGGVGVHGFFYVGSRATDNGDGTWTYSYAVQNLTSDDAGYSFGVPADASASILYPWFTDVEWHSGEPYNNDPWTWSHTGGMMTWSCQQTYGQNPDANALRWGTLYSFGFISASAPVTGTAQLGLFESGGVLVTNVAAPNAGAGLGCPGDDALEDHDDCANAFPIGPGTINNMQVHGTGSTVDWDFWAIPLEAGATIDSSIYFTHADGDVDLYLYDATGPGCGDQTSFLERSWTSTNDEHVSYTNTSGTTMNLIVEVSTYGGVTCTDYDLSTMIIPFDPCTLPDDALEDNDSCATAVAAPMGVTTGLRLSGEAYSGGVDEDYYSLTLADGDRLDVDLDFIDWDGDIGLAFYDVTAGCPGSQVASVNSSTNNESLTYDNFSGAAMDIVIFVDAVGSNFDCNDYDLDVATGVAPPSNCNIPDDSFEQNDSCAGAATASNGFYEDLWLDDFEDDYYATPVLPGETIDVFIYFLDVEADVDLTMHSACGSQVDYSGSVSNNEDCHWTNTTGGVVDVITRVYMYSTGTEDCVLYDLEIATNNTAIGTPYCFGDGTDGGACPCVAPVAGSGEGCVNMTGLGAYLTASGEPSVSADTLVLTVSQAAPADFGIYVQNISTSGPSPFYNGLICLPGNSHLVRHYSPTVAATITDASGTGVNSTPMSIGDYVGDTAPGVTIYYQFWGRDNGNPCGFGANFSSGIAVTWMP